MHATAERRTMGKARGRPKSDRDDVTVKVDRNVVDMARHVATHRGVTVAELLTEILRQPVTEAFLGVLKELQTKVTKPEGPKRPKGH